MSEQHCDDTKKLIESTAYESETALEVIKKYVEKYMEAPIFPSYQQQNQFPSALNFMSYQ